MPPPLLPCTPLPEPVPSFVIEASLLLTPLTPVPCEVPTPRTPFADPPLLTPNTPYCPAALVPLEPVNAATLFTTLPASFVTTRPLAPVVSRRVPEVAA